MRHPFEPCAQSSLCCWDLDEEITCYIIAIMCICLTAFAGTFNVGVGHWAVYIFSVFNFVFHLLAGIFLFLGTLWNKIGLKLAYCWILFICIFTVIFGGVALILTHRHDYTLWFHWDNKLCAVIVHCLNTAWLVFWDIYTPMVVLGNLDTGEDIYIDDDDS